MSGGRRSKLSPSLFPFLAVLVCTLGTLILLLALVAQKANDAVAAAEDQRAREMPETPARNADTPALSAGSVAAMTEEAQARVTQLVAVRKAQTADIEERRNQLAHVEDHTRRLAEKIRQLSDEVDRATSKDPADTVNEEQLAILQQQIEIEEQEIDELVSDATRRKPKVIIVPHKGPNGTDRRPIYLECTGDELIVWPENIRITIDQLQAAETGANPIESALRVIRHHAMTQYGDPVAPYPLLVVRPDGILTYATARGAMQDYDDQFGYELVPDGVELAMAKPDNQLKDKVDRAITVAVANQARREVIAQRNNFGGRQGGVGGSQSGSGRRLPELSAAAMDRQGRSSGYRSLRRDEQNIYTQHAGDARSIAQSYAADRASNRSQSPSVTHSGSGGANPTSQATDPAADQRLSDQMEQVADELHNRSLTDQAFDADGNPQSMLDSFLAGGSQENGDGSGSDGQFDYDGEFGGNTDQVANPNGQTGTDAESMPGQRSLQNPNATSGGSAGGSQPRSEGGPEQNPADQNFAQQQSGQQSSSGQNPPSLNLLAQESSQRADANQQQQQQGSDNDRNPPPTNPYSQTPNKDLAKPGQQGWALPREVANSHGNEILRTIRAESRSDRFVLLPTRRGRTYQESVPQIFGVFDRNATRASLELATAVRDRVQQWGAALPGGRWQPVLEVDVLPGGEVRFEQLQRMLQGSGVTVIRKN